MQKLIALLALTGLSSAPVAASVRDAAFSSSADRGQAQTGMFVGVSYRVSSGHQTNAPQARASLKMSGMMFTPGTSDLRFSEGFELAAGKSGKPAFLVGGSDIGDMRKSLKLSGGATAAIVAVGVVVVAAGIFAATYCDSHCENANAE